MDDATIIDRITKDEFIQQGLDIVHAYALVSSGVANVNRCFDNNPFF